MHINFSSKVLIKSRLIELLQQMHTILETIIIYFKYQYLCNILYFNNSHNYLDIKIMN